ncbi:MAG: hypothetical protein F6J87_13355 [Spirulina sp. SIO3F2]|nr:hypothetical protein [Spirulina sp. SIO3F2]
MPELLAERIESVRAGLWGAIALASTEGVAIGVQGNLARQGITPLFPTENLIVAIAVALGSGFLFGIAYRYIVRAETNPHLRQGAVWAFSGVRLGALLEAHPQWLMQPELRLMAIAAGLKTVVVFGIGSLVLDIALRQGWLKPLQAANQPVE